MPRRDPGVTVRQMLAHAREAVALAEGRTRSDLNSERTLTLSLIYLVQTIGEAAKRLTPEDRARWSHVSWHRITGMRNRLVHDYDRVDLDVLWQVVQRSLPCLVEELEQIERTLGMGSDATHRH